MTFNMPEASGFLIHRPPGIISAYVHYTHTTIKPISTYIVRGLMMMTTRLEDGASGDINYSMKLHAF